MVGEAVMELGSLVLMVITGFQNRRAHVTALNCQRYNYHIGGKSTKSAWIHRDMWEWLMMIMFLE